MAASPVQLTLACGDYDINQALVGGSEEIAGADAVVLTMPSPERHWRLIRHQEFDICELSMASYLVLRDRGELPYTAIPVFPHRRFRHSYLFVRDGIQSPRDLEGKRVGLRTWQTTAGVWLRGILQDFYSVDLSSIEWVTQDDEDIPLEVPLTRAPADRNVDDLLLDGHLTGLIYPEIPPSFLEGKSRRLWSDARAEEQRYFEETGIFPIMHTVVIRDELLQRQPWLAMNTVQAFRRSKDRAFARMEDPRRISLAWFRETLEEQRRVLGPDPWAYSVATNLAALQALCRYAHQQGLTRRLLDVSELFDPSSMDDPPKYVGG